MDHKLEVALLKHPKILDFEKWMASDLVIDEIWEAPKALLASLAAKKTRKTLIILISGEEGNRLLTDLPFFFEGPILEFPAWEALPEEEIPPSPDVVGQRYQVLHSLQHSSSPAIVVASLQAILQRVILPDELAKLFLRLKVGEEISFESLPSRLSEMGYHRKGIAADKGEFALRGGIIDIYPVSFPDPYRIEFFGDEIASIRKYDPNNQTSIEKVESITIFPGQELELLAKQKNLGTLFDYAGKECMVLFDDLLSLEDKATSLNALKPSPFRAYLSFLQILDRIAPLRKIYFSNDSLEELFALDTIEKTLENPYSRSAAPQSVTFDLFGRVFTAKRWHSPFLPLYPTFCPPEASLENFGGDEFILSLAPFYQSELQLFFLCSSLSEESELKQRIERLEVSLPPKSSFTKGYLSRGFYLEENKLALIPAAELNNRYLLRRQKQRSYYHTLPVEMFSFSPGEAVVHQNQGIGKYLGVEKHLNHIGIETEFLHLEYAEGGKLFLPISQSNLLSKYIGATEVPPELHTLGGSRWKRAKERSEKAIRALADDLLKVQAERELRGGFAYPENSDMVSQFAEEFPYEETPDQLLAIEEISKDMTSPKAMDRLICGDVGYGKTEVAMRAAFKAVVDGGKQVALLVPTTVLAMQHFETFSERMAGYPIKVGVLSRFCTPKQQKETLEGILSGTIDIVIGTHRLVSGDLVFRDLGLIIIDEEQRFGVRVKEHLKKVKKAVDCLTLSATPIPRTLYLSLVGSREMSLINTPPEDRLPIQTIVSNATDQVIKAALLRELTRDGQAYFIHNRVETIFGTAERLRKLLPGARIIVGHGQMSAHELDEVFHSFKTGKSDILVATSIVENGIDIPNANTIIVDRADRFGMADLYQIRGRVGRWNKKAYCYFLVPNTRDLSEISRKRLSALASSSGQGGGMKIALHDLEIRGAGNILGEEQSGHIASIGFHLYCKMLKRAVLALKTQTEPLQDIDCKIEFPYDARLPEEYVNEISLRMELYGRLGEAETLLEVNALFSEIEDRFGTPPPQVKWLKALSHIKIFAKANQFTRLSFAKTYLEAEQDHGTKNRISKKIILSPPKDPDALEKAITTALKNHFPTKKE